MKTSKPILPGSTIGIFGGGQLGRMLAMEAKRMGYNVHVYDPASQGPAAQIAGKETNASFEDEAALKTFLDGVDVATFEFENIPTNAIKKLEPTSNVLPGVSVLEICQDRLLEKTFLSNLGIKTADFQEVMDLKSLEFFLAKHRKAILKTTRLGYDGKGQLKVNEQSDLSHALSNFGKAKLIVESVVPFDCEVSIVCARNAAGEMKTFPVTQNDHENHILSTSIVPALLSDATQKKAQDVAKTIAEKIGLVGLICVEMFVVGNDVLVNELAPRPHNSGHYTLDYCQTSQFEQHLRAICGLPLGDTSLLVPAACMINLLGDVWINSKHRTPNWNAAFALNNVSLHLYGKSEPKEGRKMGHLCVFAPSAEEALLLAKEAKSALVK